MKALSLSPPKVEFLGVTTGHVYTKAVKIINVSKVSIKVRMNAPTTESFRLQADVEANLPPGLSQTIHVSFYTEDTTGREYHDSVVIYSMHEQIELPLFAEKCRPHLLPSTSHISFGNLIPGYPISRDLVITNEGTEDGQFTIKIDESEEEFARGSHSDIPPLSKILSFSTMTGKVPRGKAATVRATIICNKTGAYRGIIRLIDQYKNEELIDVSCSVIEPGLVYYHYLDDLSKSEALTSKFSTTRLSTFETNKADTDDPRAKPRTLVPLDIWKCQAIFQEETTKKIVAQNVSPYVMNYEFQVEVRDKKPLCDIGKRKLKAGETEETLAAAQMLEDISFIRVDPSAGILQPGEKVEIQLTFAPRLDLNRIERVCRFMSNTTLRDWRRIFNFVAKQGKSKAGDSTDGESDVESFDTTLIEKMRDDELKQFGTEFRFFKSNLDNIAYVYEVRTKCSASSLHKTFTDATFFSISAMATRPLVSVSDTVMHFSTTQAQRNFSVKNVSVERVKLRIVAPSSYHIDDPLNHNELTTFLLPKEQRIFYLFYNPKSMTTFNDYMYLYLGDTDYYQVTVSLITNKDKEMTTRLKNVKAVLDTGNKRAVEGMTLGDRKLLNATELKRHKEEQRLACDKTYNANKLKIAEKAKQEGRKTIAQGGMAAESSKLYNYNRMYMDKDSDSSEEDDAKYKVTTQRPELNGSGLDSITTKQSEKEKNMMEAATVVKPSAKLSSYNDALDLGMESGYGDNDYDSSYRNKRKKSRVVEELDQLDRDHGTTVVLQPKKRATLANDITAPVKLFGPSNYDNLELLRISQDIKELSTRELALISTGPTNFDLGTVTVGTKAIRYFKIANDLKNFIKIELKTTQRSVNEEKQRKREVELVEDSSSEEFIPGETLPSDLGFHIGASDMEKFKQPSVAIPTSSVKTQSVPSLIERQHDGVSDAGTASKHQINPLRAAKVEVQPYIQYLPPGSMAGFPISIKFVNITSNYADTIKIYINDKEYGVINLVASIKKPTLRLNIKAYNQLRDARDLIEKYANLLMRSVSVGSLTERDRGRDDREKDAATPISTSATQFRAQMMSDIVFFELTPANIYDKVIQKNISIVNTGTASTALALTVGADCLFSRNCVSGGDFQAQPLSVSGSHSNSTAVDGLKKSSSSTSITKGNTNTHSVTDIFTLSEVELKNFQSESNRSVLLTWCPSNAEVTAGILTLQATKGDMLYVPVLAHLLPGKASFLEKFIDYGLINIGKVSRASCTIANKSADTECYFEILEDDIVSTSLTGPERNHLIVDVTRGRLGPGERLQLQVSLTAKVLGPISTKLCFRIIGGERIELPVRAMVESPQIVISEATEGQPSLTVMPSPSMVSMTGTACSSPGKSTTKSRTNSRQSKQNVHSSPVGSLSGTSKVKTRYQNILPESDSESEDLTFTQPLLISPSHILFSEGVTQSIPTLKKFTVTNVSRVPADLFVDCTLSQYISLVSEVGVSDSGGDAGVISTLITKNDLLERFRLLSDAHMSQSLQPLKASQDAEYTLSNYINEDSGLGVTESLLRAQSKLIDKIAQKHNLPIFPGVNDFDYQSYTASLLNSNEIPDIDGSGKLKQPSEIMGISSSNTDYNRVLHIYIPPGSSTTLIMSILALDQKPTINDCVFFYLLGQTPYSEILSDPSSISMQKSASSSGSNVGTKRASRKSSEINTDVLKELDSSFLPASRKSVREPNDKQEPTLKAIVNGKELSNVLILSYNITPAAIFTSTSLVNFGIKVSDSSYKQSVAIYPPMFRDIFQRLLAHIGFGRSTDGLRDGDAAQSFMGNTELSGDKFHAIARELPFISQMALSGLYYQDINFINQTNRVILFVALVTDYNDQLLSTKLYALNQPFGKIQPYDNVSVRVFFSPAKVGVHNAKLKVYYTEVPVSDGETPARSEVAPVSAEQKTLTFSDDNGTTPRPMSPEISFFCNKGFVLSSYLTIHLQSVAVFRTIAFSANPVIFPNTAVGVPSRCLFYIRNLGYKHNVKLTITFPPELSKIAFCVIWPLGNVINHMIKTLPVLITFMSNTVMSFSSRCVISDDTGTPYNLTIGGNCANDPYLLREYLRVNSKRLQQSTSLQSLSQSATLIETSNDASLDAFQKEIYDLTPRGTDPYSLTTPEFGIYHSYNQLAEICKADETDPILRRYGLNKNVLLALESINCSTLVEFSEYSKALGLENVFYSIQNKRDTFSAAGVPPWDEESLARVKSFTLINYTSKKADTQPPGTERNDKQNSTRSLNSTKEKQKSLIQTIKRMIFGPYATTEYPRYPNANNRLAFYWHFIFRTVGLNSESCLTPYTPFIPDVVGLSTENNITISFMIQTLYLLLNLRLNANLPFPAQFTQSTSKTSPFLLWVCGILKKDININTKTVQNLPSINRLRVEFLHSCYDDMLTALKINGAMLNNIPCELLMAREDFLNWCKWSLAKVSRNSYTSALALAANSDQQVHGAKDPEKLHERAAKFHPGIPNKVKPQVAATASILPTDEFEPQLVSPMITQTNSLVILDILRAVHEFSHRSAWYFVLSELVRIFILNTTSNAKILEANIQKHKIWVSNEAIEFGFGKGIFDMKCQKESLADFHTKFDVFSRAAKLNENGCLLYLFTYHTSYMIHGTEFQEIVVNQKYTVPAKATDTKDKKNVVTRSQLALQKTTKKTAQDPVADITTGAGKEEPQGSLSPRRSAKGTPNFYVLKSSRALFSGLEVGLTILSHYPYCDGIRRRAEELMSASVAIAKSFLELGVSNFTPDYILNLKIKIPEITDRMFSALESARSALWLEIEQFLRLEFNISLLPSSLYMTSPSSTFDYSHNVAYTNALATNHQILATLLYQVLPSYLPYKTLRILSNLGDTVTQPLEVSNAMKSSSIKYKTSILYPRSDDVSAGGPSCEIKLNTNMLTIEPRMSSTLSIKMTPRFAKPCVALVGLRPSYDVSSQTSSGSFLAPSFVAVIIETNDTVPVKVYEVESKCQQQSKISIDVDNKNGLEANYKIRITEKFVALDSASLSTNVKPKKVFGYMEPLATQAAKTVNPAEKKAPEAVMQPLCGVTTSPIAFKTNERSLNIKPRGRQAMNLYYMPTHPGAYIASIIFEDANLGSFMYELRGYSILPDISYTYNISSLATESRTFNIDIGDLLGHDLVHKYVNHELKQVIDTKQADDAKQTQAIQLASSIDSVNKTFTIKYVSKPNIEPDVHAFRFLIVTDTFTKQGLIYLNLLKRQEEIQMEMIVPAREAVSQKLPVRNTMDNDCLMSVTITSQGQNATQRTIRGGNQKQPPSSLINYFQVNGQAMTDGVPFTMLVRPHDSPFILLEFKPKWMALFNAKLMIKNSTKDLLVDEYLLKCQATEPLTSGVINLETVAMEPVVYKFTVSNPPLLSDNEQALNSQQQAQQITRYTVYLQDKKAVFELSHSSFDLAPGASQVVELRGFSPCSGQSKNVLFIQNNGTNTYEWYEVILHVKPRECSGVIELQTLTNVGVRHEFSITNTRSDIYANVTVEVMNIPYYLLSFSPSMQIEPGDTQSFILNVRPTCRGVLKGVVIFNSMELGEFWYELVVTCSELAVKEETVYSLLSAQVSSKIMIENPNPTTALTYTIENSNHNAFTSHPKSSFIVQHSSQEIVKINYRPTKVNLPEIGEFYIYGVDSKGVIQSEYKYVFRGIGQMPKEQTTTRIYANVGSSNAGVVTFKNPFLTSSLLRFEYENSPDLQFNIRPEMIIQPFCDVQLPFTFTPKSLKLVRAKFLVHVQQLADTEAGIDTAEILKMGEETFTTLLSKSEVYTFTYPIEATAEIVLNETFAFMACSARNSVSVTKPVPFDSLARYSAGDMSFFIEPIDTRTLKPDSAFHIAQKSIQFFYRPSGSLSPSGSTRVPQVLGGIGTSPQISLSFTPMKPFACDVNMIISIRNSGRYKLPLQLVANTPKPEGTITVELANSNTEGEYILKICNIYNVYTEYKASFSPTSSERFSVSPSSGILEPAQPASAGNQKMTHIRIACSPGSSQARGQLFVETKDVLFIWDVISGYKKYVPPAGVSKVVCRE